MAWQLFLPLLPFLFWLRLAHSREPSLGGWWLGSLVTFVSMCYETACPGSALGVWGCPALATPALLNLQPDVLAFGEYSLEPQFAAQCISHVCIRYWCSKIFGRFHIQMLIWRSS